MPELLRQNTHLHTAPSAVGVGRLIIKIKAGLLMLTLMQASFFMREIALFPPDLTRFSTPPLILAIRVNFA